MAKHVPGPWEVGDENWAGLARVTDATGVLIATCNQSGYIVRIPEMEANARLIAAAPDLLRVLRQSLAVVRWAAVEAADDDERAETFKAIEADARAAIAKAEGK